jgi:hypothetical protein
MRVVRPLAVPIDKGRRGEREKAYSKEHDGSWARHAPMAAQWGRRRSSLNPGSNGAAKRDERNPANCESGGIGSLRINADELENDQQDCCGQNAGKYDERLAHTLTCDLTFELSGAHADV